MLLAVMIAAEGLKVGQKENEAFTLRRVQLGVGGDVVDFEAGGA